MYKNGVLEFFNHPEGYVEKEADGYKYVYQFKDHLGNIRLSYKDRDNDGKIDVVRNNIDIDGDNDNLHEIIQIQDYYPFGLEIEYGADHPNSLITGSNEHPYKFQGVELNEDLGLNLYEMDFRQYDPAIGRFTSTDPLAEERNWLTPYNFVQNNPILRIDPSGLLDDYGIDQQGNISLLQKTDDNTDTLYATTTNENGETVKDESKGSVTVGKESDGSSIVSDLANNMTTEQYDDYGITKERSVSIAVTDEKNKNDVFKVFKFAADNSNVEWSVGKINYQGLGTNYQIGTYHERHLSPGIRNSKIGSPLGLLHSHPNQLTNSERNESLGGDTSVSTNFLRRYGANKPYLIYFPSTQNTTRLLLPREDFLIGSTVRKRNNQKIKF
ncbi:RHS repeat-associated core domain-containing protein [Aquimarina sp. MAR_2010_214]|uniref:RHS repeat-associated core domain-containing protein n=1 Tax=Aquimarina sp. MAR_2010_214 TaxID=1250026 RepID=UPI000C708872|nr:RHS repeat-associated core domain-containing protein [Aquimarina sp. MAR_2010_214]